MRVELKLFGCRCVYVCVCMYGPHMYVCVCTGHIFACMCVCMCTGRHMAQLAQCAGIKSQMERLELILVIQSLGCVIILNTGLLTSSDTNACITVTSHTRIQHQRAVGHVCFFSSIFCVRSIQNMSSVTVSVLYIRYIATYNIHSYICIVYI